MNGLPTSIASNVTSRTLNTVKRFREEKAHGTLEKYYPQLNTIITVLCNANYASDLDIVNFLMGKKPIEECGCLDNPAANRRLQQATSKIKDYLPSLKGQGGILREQHSMLSGKEHYINNNIAECLTEVFNGGHFGIWFDEDGATDKLHQLYVQTSPKADYGEFVSVDFATLRTSGTFPDNNRLAMFTANVAHHVADKVSQLNLNKKPKPEEYNHQDFNKKLGFHNGALAQLNEDKESQGAYFKQFAEFLGVPAHALRSYLTENPITVMHDPELIQMAAEDLAARMEAKYSEAQTALEEVKEDQQPYSSELTVLEDSDDDSLQIMEATADKAKQLWKDSKTIPELTDLKQLCALSDDDLGESTNNAARVVKHGAITSMPGALIFGTHGCGNNYDQTNVHFGENIHAIGLMHPDSSTDIYSYYKKLYENIIIKACAEQKIDCLVLNGVGDGDFANNDQEKEMNAKARLDAVIELKSIIAKNGMKIILPDYANNFADKDKQNFKIAMGKIRYKILSGKEEADLQGQALAQELKNSKYVGLVNASDQKQYGANFLTLKSDGTVEEGIWNSMFIGPHYDPVMIAYPNCIKYSKASPKAKQAVASEENVIEI